MKKLWLFFRKLRGNAYDKTPPQFITRFDDWCDDWVWVLWTFLRGKVLCQSAYMPQGNAFGLSGDASFKRVKMLMQLWGLSLLTLEEYQDLTNRRSGFCRVLAIHHTKRCWYITGRRDDWGSWDSANAPILVLAPSYLGVPDIIRMSTTPIRGNDPCPRAPIPERMRQREQSNRRFEDRQRTLNRSKVSR